MKKLRSSAYKIVLAASVLLALVAAVLGAVAAVQDEAEVLGWAVALCAAAVAGLAVALHFRTGHILQAARRAQVTGPAQQVVAQAGLVAVDDSILTELQELRKSVKLSLNNEMFLLDEIQRVNAQRTDDH
ncbi:hypothetical protein [Tessaracoccus massiliensis]|uniref:hypothetical protein n=1 Tax=Tessaracoccus massiliensis TaxID=1522311 RepID=UPI0005912D5A|nr:hypothetical protein [Tessaracoccus massiliensis]